jgi:hypothetical protein
MVNRTIATIAAAGGLGLASLAGTLGGCDSLPGNKQTQGAVIGGAGGAVAGAAIAKDKPLLGALIGGALGAGGGYLIGANWDKITGKDTHAAQQAVQKSQTSPATAQQARNATTADINNDGFVTLDEVSAMKQAGFNDDEMIQRLQTTGQVFDLSPQNEQDLRNQGVDQRVIDAMKSMNRQQPTPQPAGGQVLSHPR